MPTNPHPYIVTLPIPCRQVEAVVGPFASRTEAEAYRSMLAERTEVDVSRCRVGHLVDGDALARSLVMGARPATGAIVPVRN